MTSTRTQWPDVQALIDDYRPGAFFFSSPTGSLLAEGVHTDVSLGGPPAALAARAQEALTRAAADGVSDPVLVGALPFVPGGPGRLVIPRSVRRGPTAGPGPGALPPSRWSVTPEPEPSGYEQNVRDALAAIAAGEVDKVVLARTLRLSTERDVDPAALLRAVAGHNPDAYAFAADLPPGSRGATRTLVGASPELLVHRTGTHVHTRPLAGSAARSGDAVADQTRADALTASGKDHHEHAVVVAAVTAALRPYCADLAAPATPELTSTPAMWHLATTISGPLRDKRISSLELAAALHPTPAVGGWPRDAATRLIARLEPFERGCYAGAVGWCDARGDGEWAIAIRCAEVDGPDVRLFAGAGIVDGSQPATELAETSAKFVTLLDALNLSDPARAAGVA